MHCAWSIWIDTFLWYSSTIQNTVLVIGTGTQPQAVCLSSVAVDPVSTSIAKRHHENNKMTLAGKSNLYQIKGFTVTAELRKGFIKSSQRWRQEVVENWNSRHSSVCLFQSVGETFRILLKWIHPQTSAWAKNLF